MRFRAALWAFGIAWRIDRRILILCCVLLSAVSVLPAAALTYRQEILAALNRFLSIGEGSMEEILPVILLFGGITVLAGLANRLNDEFIYSIMFNSYYFGMEEILMDSVQEYTMEELLGKDAKDEYYACVMREGSLTDFISGFCSLLGKFVGLVSLLRVAFSASKPVCAIILLYTIGVVWLNLLSIKRQRSHWERIRDKERLAAYYEGLPSAPDCAKEIRIFGSQKRILEKWREAYGAVFDNELKNSLNTELRTFASGMGFYLFLGVMILQTLGEVAAGRIAAETLLVLFTLCINVFAAVSGVARTLVSVDYGLSALERQYRVFEIGKGRRGTVSAETEGLVSPKVCRAGQGALAWEQGSKAGADFAEESVFRTEGISFSYQGDKKVLADVSVSVRRGETVALVGPNGSGKSTFVKALLQLYRPAAGKIYYLGRDYEGLRDGFLGNKIGAFFQDYYLFHVSIWENIGFGDIENVEDRRRIQAALEKGQAASFVRSLPFGEETFVHRSIVKEGREFSGGEQQKLAISRAYMSDKDIFIFDEPASMLDPISELEQFMSIRDTVKGKTAILISHRIGFARLADKIIVMDQGRVAETGTHQELMAKKGLYARMFLEQAQWYRQETEEGGFGNAQV